MIATKATKAKAKTIKPVPKPVKPATEPTDEPETISTYSNEGFD